MTATEKKVIHTVLVSAAAKAKASYEFAVTHKFKATIVKAYRSDVLLTQKALDIALREYGGDA